MTKGISDYEQLCTCKAELPKVPPNVFTAILFTINDRPGVLDAVAVAVHEIVAKYGSLSRRY